jgi:CheY-like chemotaxis protein
MPKPVIWTVDDDPDVLRAVERDLRRQYGDRYKVISADSGASALEAVKQLKLRNEPVALFLVDQRMPRMSGVEFLEKAIEFYPDAKRALLTAYADTDAAIRAINSVHIDHYLMKPWDPPEERLYGVVDDLLDDWQASGIIRCLKACASSGIGGLPIPMKSAIFSGAILCPTNGSTSRRTRRPSNFSKRLEPGFRRCRWSCLPTDRSWQSRHCRGRAQTGIENQGGVSLLRFGGRGRGSGRDWRPLFMARRMACTRCWSNARRPAGRPGAVPASKIISAFRWA